MKTKVTLWLDSDVLREVRSLAGKQGVSVTTYLTAKLEQSLPKRRDYDSARRRALARLGQGFNRGWKRPVA